MANNSIFIASKKQIGVYISFDDFVCGFQEKPKLNIEKSVNAHAIQTVKICGFFAASLTASYTYCLYMHTICNFCSNIFKQFVSMKRAVDKSIKKQHE